MDPTTFKSVNDTHGHPCGDKVIQAMALICQTETRMIDIPARTAARNSLLLLPFRNRPDQIPEAAGENFVLRPPGQGRMRGQGPDLSPRPWAWPATRGKEVPDPVRARVRGGASPVPAKRAGKDRIECAPILDLGR